MLHETASQQSTTAPAPWPPDDTEESVVGIDLHQITLTNLRWGINELAGVRQASGQAVPWHAITQLLITGCRRPDGSYLRVLPDLFVYPHAVDPYRGSWAIGVDGPPVLVIEVLSPSTFESDLDLARGKGYSYARAGVREYLTLDPTGMHLPEQGRGWRLVDGADQPWERDGEGRWQSEAIEAAFGVAGIQVAIYARDGRRMLREGEVEAELARERAMRERDQAELARLRRLLGEEADRS